MGISSSVWSAMLRLPPTGAHSKYARIPLRQRKARFERSSTKRLLAIRLGRETALCQVRPSTASSRTTSCATSSTPISAGGIRTATNRKAMRLRVRTCHGVRDASPIGQQFPGVVKNDHTVAQQPPSLLGMESEQACRVMIESICRRTLGLMLTHCGPLSSTILRAVSSATGRSWRCWRRTADDARSRARWAFCHPNGDVFLREAAWPGRKSAISRWR